MTSIADGEGRLAPFSARWIEARGEEQQRVLPSGEVVVSCSAPPGAGGLGRHCAEIVLALERSQSRATTIAGGAAVSGGEAVRRPVAGLLRRVARRSPAWRAWADCVAYDRYASAHLPAGEHLIAFNGEAARQFATARRGAYRSVSLMAANSHMRQVIRLHAAARRSYPIEQPYSERLLARNLRDYDLAERIYYASEYIRESFLEQGIAGERLARFPLTPDPRYTPRQEPPAGPCYEIVYVGALTVAKGVPLLIDAVSRLPQEDLRLTLVGGWGTPGMRRFMQRALAADPRIEVSPGDPLPHLRRASLFVHASWEDGFAYAPAEALAAGVPVLVSEDTGMKELIAGPEVGRVLPTGDLAALTEAIEASYRGELFGR
jgi:glycosyltransferase involved in cell wall biosynthesis